MAEFDVAPAAQPYYDRVTLEDAIEATTEAINDWDYAADPHGYCHERPFLIALVTALRSPNGSAVGPTT